MKNFLQNKFSLVKSMKANTRLTKSLVYMCVSKRSNKRQIRTRTSNTVAFVCKSVCVSLIVKSSRFILCIVGGPACLGGKASLVANYRVQEATYHQKDWLTWHITTENQVTVMKKRSSMGFDVALVSPYRLFSLYSSVFQF